MRRHVPGVVPPGACSVRAVTNTDGCWEVYDYRHAEKVVAIFSLQHTENAVKAYCRRHPFADYERIGKHRAYTMNDNELAGVA